MPIWKRWAVYAALGRKTASDVVEAPRPWPVQMPPLIECGSWKRCRENCWSHTERMLRELGEALIRITAERPLVLVLEDLQWSDASNLELLVV